MPQENLSKSQLTRYAIARTFFPPQSVLKKSIPSRPRVFSVRISFPHLAIPSGIPRIESRNSASKTRFAHSKATYSTRSQGLKQAIDRLGFVQADPIRAPARAQDLILRHRVADYQIDDLERLYPELGLDEDFLYAYGFLPNRIGRLLHPRAKLRLNALQKRILDTVNERGVLHPRELEKELGSSRVINAWGGFSQASKQALEVLHRHGYLRVAGRENGIRLYGQAHPIEGEKRPPSERFAQILLVMLRVMAPVNPRMLLSECLYLGYILPKAKDRRLALDALMRSGEIASGVVEGVEYIWPSSEKVEGIEENRVRILAPFDPLVRDRGRFEQLWGWVYRFEAYTPVAKRVRGYYAMPLLWRSNVVGWVNGTAREGRFFASLGFVDSPPRDSRFQPELEKELSRFARFLKLDESSWEIVSAER